MISSATSIIRGGELWRTKNREGSRASLVTTACLLIDSHIFDVEVWWPRRRESCAIWGPEIPMSFGRVRGSKCTASTEGIIESENEQTYLYIQFDVIRLGEPLSHSGTKVMNPERAE